MTHHDKLVVFILTNGRPNNVDTYNTLIKSGYSGEVYFIVDNLDNTKDVYIEKYGNKVIIFDKKTIAKNFDSGNNFNDMRSVIYARNACFEIARNLNIKYFIQLDDDYTSFQYRFNNYLDYQPKTLKNIDEVFRAILKFYIKSGALSIALSQGGDFIGGDESNFSKHLQLKRKCMNSFFCSTDRLFNFIGIMNDDVNTYTSLSTRGSIFFTINHVNLNQRVTQSNPGGLTELYLDFGTYVKSFYSVMFLPSSVKISMIRGAKGTRIHHKVLWKKTTPMILNESIKKKYTHNPGKTSGNG